MDTRNYSDWILHNQDRLGWGNGETAKRAKMSPTTITNLISGKIGQPHYKTLRKLARAFEVEVPEDPRKPILFSLEWARSVGDAEFYHSIIEAEDTDRLDSLQRELGRFVQRPLKRVLRERNGRVFEDVGPEPEPGEREPMRARLGGLRAEVKHRRPPFARLRMSSEGNEARWLIPPEQWEQHRDRVDAYFEGEPYRNVDAREEISAYEEEHEESAQYA